MWTTGTPGSDEVASGEADVGVSGAEDFGWDGVSDGKDDSEGTAGESLSASEKEGDTEEGGVLVVLTALHPASREITSKEVNMRVAYFFMETSFIFRKNDVSVLLSFLEIQILIEELFQPIKGNHSIFAAIVQVGVDGIRDYEKFFIA